MTTVNFFDESSDQSQVKAAIIAKYFWAWAKVVMPWAQQRGDGIAYIDLFAGPGRYLNGAKSTPLLVLERAIQDPGMRDMLITLFNDVNSDNCRSLETNINALPGVQTLRHKPVVMNEEVGTAIVAQFEQTKLIPTLFFVDPWGYKGLSLRLVNSVLQNWGCDCVFFFNYNRINMGLPNAAVTDHMNALFGDQRADRLRTRLQGLESGQRELAIVEELAKALKEMGGKYVLPFRFKNDQGIRTSHHLIFVSKHPRGYGIMKEIMAGYSSSHEQGVPSFEYNPVHDRQFRLLFELARPLDDLGDMLLDTFAGQTRTMKEIYESHHIDTPYIARNYKEILGHLEAEGKIRADPPAQRRRRLKGVVTFGDDVRVTFP